MYTQSKALVYTTGSFWLLSIPSDACYKRRALLLNLHQKHMMGLFLFG
jgi:hypothetical protein